MATQSNQYLAAGWRKSSACAAMTDCVEVACSESLMLVRGSVYGPERTLRLTAAQWRGFVRHIKNGSAVADWPQAGNS